MKTTFAFTIVDDTDGATLENVKPLYDLLISLNIRITKTVWPLRCEEANNPYAHSETLQDRYYADWVKALQANGFEIAFHGASAGSNLRAKTLQGLDVFAKILGRLPSVHINHHKNKDNLYWAVARFNSLLPRTLVGLNQKRRKLCYEGEKEDSPYFWGDICQQTIRYSRNLTFVKQIDLTAINSTLPYADPYRPYVPRWFSACDGGNPKRFVQLLSPKNLQRLVEQRGVCIVYAHFGQGFVQDGEVLPEVEVALRRIAEYSDGQFAPVTELLDARCSQDQVAPVLTESERRRMERVWLWEKLWSGGTS